MPKDLLYFINLQNSLPQRAENLKKHPPGNIQADVPDHEANIFFGNVGVKLTSEQAGDLVFCGTDMVIAIDKTWVNVDKDNCVIDLKPSLNRKQADLVKAKREQEASQSAEMKEWMEYFKKNLTASMDVRVDSSKDCQGQIINGISSGIVFEIKRETPKAKKPEPEWMMSTSSTSSYSTTSSSATKPSINIFANPPTTTQQTSTHSNNPAILFGQRPTSHTNIGVVVPQGTVLPEINGLTVIGGTYNYHIKR